MSGRVSGGATWPRALRVVRRVAMVGLMVGIVLRPGVGEVPVPTRLSDLEVLVVVDRTTSMTALDHGGGSRIEGVRADLTALAGDLPGARLSVVTFGGVVRTELPFTSDTTSFEALVGTLLPEGPLDGTGSRVDKPLEVMREVLARAEEQHPERRRMVVFVSDGENTAEGEQASFADLAPLVDGGAVLGYGTEAGGTMPYDPERPDGSVIFDAATGEDARSVLDEDNLRTIAEQLGVGYVHPGAADGEGASAMADLAAGLEARPGDGEDEATAKYEITWVLALALLALALLELRSSWRGLAGARREGRTA